MKKTLRIAGLALAGMFLFSSVTSMAGTAKFAGNGTAKRGMASIKVTKASGTMKIDGKAKEKSWSKAKNYASKVNGYILTKNKTINAKKTSKMATVKTFKLLWNSKGLYCFMQVNDKTKSMNASGSPTDSDSIEYHIDANYLRRTSFGSDKNDAQYRLARDGKTVSGWGSYNRNAFKSNAKGSTTASSYQQEIMIRWDNHNAKNVKKGKKVGFDIQVNDAVSNARTYQIVWNSWDNAWVNPSTMGTIILN